MASRISSTRASSAWATARSAASLVAESSVARRRAASFAWAQSLRHGPRLDRHAERVPGRSPLRHTHAQHGVGERPGAEAARGALQQPGPRRVRAADWIRRSNGTCRARIRTRPCITDRDAVRGYLEQLDQHLRRSAIDIEGDSRRRRPRCAPKSGCTDTARGSGVPLDERVSVPLLAARRAGDEGRGVLRPRRGSTRSRLGQRQHEVVAVHRFLAGARQELAHLGRLQPLDAPQLLGGQVADALADLRGRRRSAAITSTASPASNSPSTSTTPTGQQAGALLAQRALRAGVDTSRLPLERLRVAQPQLEARLPLRLRMEARADRLAAQRRAAGCRARCRCRSRPGSRPPSPSPRTAPCCACRPEPTCELDMPIS